VGKRPKVERLTRRSNGLVARAQAGDAGAFDRLLGRHQRRVLRTAWRLLGDPEEARDAAQEVFLRLYRHLHRIDPRRPLAPWLYRVTVNVCRDLGRRRRRPLPLEEVAEPPDPGADPARRASLAEERRIVEEGLAGLPEKERAALVLRDVEGLATSEVAAILGSSETTVRSQISRARLKVHRHRERHLGRRTS